MDLVSLAILSALQVFYSSMDRIDSGSVACGQFDSSSDVEYNDVLDLMTSAIRLLGHSLQSPSSLSHH